MRASCTVGRRLGLSPAGAASGLWPAPAQQGPAPAEAGAEATAGDQVPGLDAAVLHGFIEHQGDGGG